MRSIPMLLAGRFALWFALAGMPVEVFYSEKLDSLGRASDEVGYALVGGQLQTD